MNSATDGDSSRAAFARRPWPLVLEDLRGHRLAVYDDVMRGLRLAADSATTDSLGWLTYHRLVVLVDGRLCARQLANAAALYNQHGAAPEDADRVARWRALQTADEPAAPSLQLEPTCERWRKPKPAEFGDKPRAPADNPNQRALPL